MQCACGEHGERAGDRPDVGERADQLLFTYAPVMNTLFHSVPIGANAWPRIVAVAAAVFVTVEFENWLGGRRTQGTLPE